MIEGKIKFAVVGAGHIGKRHATIISQNEDCELVAIVDNNQEQNAVAELLGVPFFTSQKELFQSGLKVDVVNVCSPNGSHAELSVEALNNNCHVVCEKPMSLSKTDCEEIIHTSMQKNKLVFGVMQNRYSPPSVWLKEVVSSGKLGSVFMVQINCFWNRDERYYKSEGWKGKKDLDGGTLFTQFSHFVDILYWLFGDITNIKSTIRDFNHQALTDFEDSGTVTFDFIKGGGIGTLNFSTSVWDKNLESSMTIIAEKGSIKIDGQYMDEVKFCHIKDYEIPKLAPTNPANDYGTYKGSAANHHYIIENVVDTLKGKTVATTNALEGMKVVEIIERIYASGNS